MTACSRVTCTDYILANNRDYDPGEQPRVVRIGKRDDRIPRAALKLQRFRDGKSTADGCRVGRYSV